MRYKLSEICISQYGYTASSVEKNTGTQFLRITDIVPRQIDWRSVPYCPISADDRKKYILKKNDIVVARTGATVGYAKYIKRNVDAVFASYLVRLNIKKIYIAKINPKYLGLLVESQSYKDYIRMISSGSAQPNANAQDIMSAEFDFPNSLETQQKIADILSRYDDLIETNNRRIALLEESARELYKEWFVRMRFPGYEQTKFVNGMPKGWKTVRLSSVVQYVSERVYVDSIKLYVSTDSMAKDYGGLDIPSLTEPVESNVIKFRVNDILVSNIRPYFKKIWFANCNGGCSSDVLVIRAKNSKYQLYVYYSICNDCFFDYMMAGANGTKMPRGNKDFTVTFSLFIPNEELINRFTLTVGPISLNVNILQRQVSLLSQQRDRLLPRLMSGEIKVE